MLWEWLASLQNQTGKRATDVLGCLHRPFDLYLTWSLLHPVKNQVHTQQKPTGHLAALTHHCSARHKETKAVLRSWRGLAYLCSSFLSVLILVPGRWLAFVMHTWDDLPPPKKGGKKEG